MGSRYQCVGKARLSGGVGQACRGGGRCVEGFDVAPEAMT